MRATSAENGIALASAGSVRLLRYGITPSDIGTNPTAGNILKCTANSHINIKPSQNTGTLNPSTANTITPLSVKLPTFQAAITPIGMPNRIDSTIANIPRLSVGCRRGAMRLVIVCFEKIEVPRSP